MVPDIPTFAVDNGFSYRVPPALLDQVMVGSVVRVPLAGRRVRGYVVGLKTEDEASGARKLREVRSVSSTVPVFTEAMLPSLRWAAAHYVAPLAGVLAKSAPPNLPKQPVPRQLPSIPPAGSPITRVAGSAQSEDPGIVQLLAGGGWGELIRRCVTGPLRAGRSALVVAPTAVEAARLADRLEGDLGRRVVRAADQDNAALTAAWSRAATQGGLVVVGTLRVIWWPVKDLSMICLVEEGRRGMKERQTPTVAAGTVARMRSPTEGLRLVLIGRAPTVDTLHEDAVIERIRGRLWARVELVDRTEDPPGGGLVAERVRVAIASTIRRDGRVFVFTHRRGYAPASRCVSCRSLRSCPACGSRPGHRDTCPRCEAVLGPCPSCGGNRFEPLGAAVGRITETLRRLVGDGVGSVGSDRAVMVGTERDLVEVPPVDLAVVVDADGLVRGTNYRSTEEALAVLARTASTLRRNGRCRMMLQTADTRHPVYEALQLGDPIPFLRDELVARWRFSLPPCGEVMVVEVEGTEEAAVLDAAFAGADVYGPARDSGRTRWIVQGRELREQKQRLRAATGRLRDQGCKVRIDVDPREF
ncbi:MAG: hypothetical protein OXS29_13025 [bacterium]|nr:hypothetical protein [bacterium]MDE0288405.1 hypothetical protein [bacterium]MDE0438733.1 hypothetical protein [bacterium]